MSPAWDTVIPDTATPWSRVAPGPAPGTRGGAEDFFVHPQAVRYCLSQFRELYGGRLEDPRFVMEVTLALP